MDIVGGLASKGLIWLFDQFGEWSIGWMTKGVSVFVETVLESITDVTGSFWDESIVELFLNFSFTINITVMVFSLLFFLIEIGQQAGRINWIAVINNYFKVLIFIFFNRYMGLGALTIAEILTDNLNLSMEAPTPSGIVNILISDKNVILMILLLLCVLIAYIAFFIMSMQRNGMMFVQILSSAFYIPGILNGDTASLGDWLRQTVAIAGTYILQYYMFYLGITYFLSSPLICLTFWAGMFAVPRVLEKFGYASGASGVLSAAGSTIGAGLSLGKVGG